MEWYFFFVAMIWIMAIRGNQDRRRDRLERRIALMLERIGIDVDEVYAEIARM
mgnify:FL=1|jgi:hypothetical protein